MKVKIKGFVHKSTYRTGFDINSCDMSEYGHILIGTHEFEYEIPADFNPIKAQVDMLEKKLDEMADEYHGKVKQIKDKIAELQCIEYSPSVDFSADEVTF